MHLDRQFTWHKYTIIKRKQLSLILTQGHKTLLYKPVWQYNIKYWGTTCNFSVGIMQKFQNKMLRAVVVDPPRYIPNSVISIDIKITLVSEVTV